MKNVSFLPWYREGIFPTGVLCFCYIFFWGRKGEIGICFLHHFSSVAQLCLTLCDPMNAARQASLSITNSRSLPKLMSIESVMPSKHLILCCPRLLLPSIFPSIRVFSNESLRIRWTKYWSFSFSITPSNEYSGLISFRIDWFDLLADHGILKNGNSDRFYFLGFQNHFGR